MILVKYLYIKYHLILILKISVSVSQHNIENEIYTYTRKNSTETNNVEEHNNTFNNLVNLTSSHYSTLTVNYMTSVNFFNCQHAFCKKVPPQNTVNNQVSTSAGQLLKGLENKLYLVTKKQVTFVDIWTECCKWDMIPASVETKEMLHLLQLHHDKKIYNGNTKIFTNQLDVKLDRNFISCVSGNKVPREVFLPGEPDNKDNSEACLAIKIKKWDVGLADVYCGDTAHVLCEVTENLQRFTSPRNLTSSHIKNDNIVNNVPYKLLEKKAPYFISRTSIQISSTTIKPKNIMTTTPWSRLPQMPTATTKFTMPPILATTKITIFTNENIFHTRQLRN